MYHHYFVHLVSLLLPSSVYKDELCAPYGHAIFINLTRVTPLSYNNTT
nr:MAG TPA: hypothetical protein [Caudoviricetes sp.]DAY34216.1 MAG TPA: hypothetical protein [Caudoviricetes sp.]